LKASIKLYKFGDRLATFLRNDLKMLSHFDMRVLIFDTGGTGGGSPSRRIRDSEKAAAYLGYNNIGLREVGPN